MKRSQAQVNSGQTYSVLTEPEPHSDPHLPRISTGTAGRIASRARRLGFRGRDTGRGVEAGHRAVCSAVDRWIFAGSHKRHAIARQGPRALTPELLATAAADHPQSVQWYGQLKARAGFNAATPTTRA